MSKPATRHSTSRSLHQTLAAWLMVFGSALLSGWLAGPLFRAHRAAVGLFLTAAIVVAGAIIFSQTTSGPLALASVLLLDAFAVVGGGSLSGVRKA